MMPDLLPQIINPATYRGDEWPGFQPFYGGSGLPSFFTADGDIRWSQLWESGGIEALFRRCGPIASVVMNLAEAYANGRPEFLNPTSLKYVRGAYKQWDTLFARPNPIQSGGQWRRQLYAYRLIAGTCFALKVYPVGMERQIPAKLWLLPPEHIEIEPLQRSPLSINSQADLVQNVWFTAGGVRTKLNPKDLIVFQDSTPVYDPNTWLTRTRLVGCRQDISLIESAVEAELTMIQRKGALGFISNTAKDVNGWVPVDNAEKEMVQREFANYGLTRKQQQYIITNASLSWQSMTFPTKDLLLQESFLKAYKNICEHLGYPFILTSQSDQSTYNNVPAASTRLYSGTILPQAADIDEQLAAGLDLAGNGVLLKTDYSHLPELQESQESKGKGLQAMYSAYTQAWELGTMTRNDILVAMGEDKKSLPEFDLYKWQLDAAAQQAETQQQDNTPDSINQQIV